VWNQARREGHKQAAKELKGARFVLWKNPGKLTDRQRLKLAHIQQTNKPLYRAYLISQQLRDIYRVSYQHAIDLLDACSRGPDDAGWRRSSSWRRRSPNSVRESRLRFSTGCRTPGPSRSIPQLRLITRRAYGFRTPEADRPRHAQTRRTLPAVTRMTPGNSRRSLFVTEFSIAGAGSDSLGWDEVHQGVLRVHRFSGDHHAMVTDGHVGAVAEIVSTAVKEARRAALGAS
jgi:hypothetical protein